MKALCRCDGRYEGCEHRGRTCPNEPGTAHSGVFCSECDPRRLAHITRNLGDIAVSLAASPEGGEGR